MLYVTLQRVLCLINVYTVKLLKRLKAHVYGTAVSNCCRNSIYCCMGHPHGTELWKFSHSETMLLVENISVIQHPVEHAGIWQNKTDQCKSYKGIVWPSILLLTAYDGFVQALNYMNMIPKLPNYLTPVHGLCLILQFSPILLKGTTHSPWTTFMLDKDILRKHLVLRRFEKLSTPH